MIRTFDFALDLTAVLDLWQAAAPGVHLGMSDTPEELKKKIERDPELFIVAEENGALVGAVMGGFDGRRGMVYHLAVAPTHRAKGIGKQLMQELEARFKAKGCLKYYLLVTAQNQEVVNFYERLGWYDMQMTIMGKNIK